MTNNVLLDNLSHKDLKVTSQYSAGFGENFGSALAFPTEFAELQKEYPILFRQDAETGKYQATVLLGLQQDENLFLDEQSPSGWAAHYVPGIIAKGPFLIGRQNQVHDGEEQSVPVVHIDLDHVKVTQQDGYALFLEHGGNSPYLEHISSTLIMLGQGMAIQDDMFSAFTEMDLIESVDINIELDNGDQRKLIGNFTINTDKLDSLNGEQLVKLNNSGFLALAHAVVFSMTNIRKLTEIKNARNR